MKGLLKTKRIWHFAKTVTASILIVVMAARDLVAGDILRQSTSLNSSTTTPAGKTPSVGTTAGLPSAQDQLARTSQALQTVQAMQAAARALALQGPNNLGADPNHPGATLPDVPGGLLAGGLQVDPQVSVNPSLWSGASLPQESLVGGQTEVTVAQNAPQADLNWSSFNIGKQTTLNFDQSLGGSAQSSWIAFNKVNDPTGVPSQRHCYPSSPGGPARRRANWLLRQGNPSQNHRPTVWPRGP